MAETKRVFQIKINGITESTDAVKALREELKDVESSIKNLKNASVSVKVSSGDANSSKTKVSSGSSTEDKETLALQKEQQKQLELQDETLRSIIRQKEELKNLNKAELDDIKQQASGYSDIVDGVKVYANTLNGMSAELKDIKSELRNMDVDSDGFQELTERAAELNSKLKEAENAYGQFGRNVGNYTQSILDALEQWDGKELDFNVAGAEGSLNDLKSELAELKKYWATLSPDDANFDKTAKAIKSLTGQVEALESSIKGASDDMNATFNGRFTTTIGGMEVSFSNASEACEALRKKLVAMRVAGEQNTPMYQEIIELVRKLQKEVAAATSEIDGMTETSRGLNKVVSVFKGLSGIASLGQGIAGLFGGSSEELDKVIQKFASLSLVLNGISSIEEELNKGTSAFAKFTNAALDMIDKIPGIKQVSDAIKGLEISDAAIDQAMKLNELMSSLQFDAMDELISAESIDDLRNGSEAARDFAAAYDELGYSADDFKDVQENISGVINGMTEDSGNLQAGLNRVQKAMVSLNTNLKLTSKTYGELAAAEKTQITLFGRQVTILNAMGVAYKAVAVGAQAASVAVKGLTVAVNALAKATIIIAVIQALGAAFEYITKALTGAWNALKSLFGIMSDESAEKLTKQVEDLNAQLDALEKERQIQVQLGNLGEVEAQLKGIEDRLNSLADMKRLIDSQSEMNEWEKQLIDNLDTECDAWEKLTEQEKKAAEAMMDLAKLDPGYFTKLKAMRPEEQLKSIEAALGGDITKLTALEGILGQSDEGLEQFLDKLSDIDSDLNDIGVKGARSFGKLSTSINQVRQQVAQAVARMRQDLDNLTKTEYQLRLSLDATDFESRMAIVKMEMEDMASQYGMKMNSDGSVSKKSGGKMSDDEKEIAQHLANINALQEKAAKQQQSDAEKRRKEEQERENEAAEKAVEEARKKAEQKAATRIEAMSDGLDKEIAMLEQQRKSEIAESSKTGKEVADINTIYDRKVLEVKKKYAKYIEDEERAHNQRIMDATNDFLREWTEIQRQIEDERANTQMTNIDNDLIENTSRASHDTSLEGSERVDAEKEYYDKLTELQVNHANEAEQLEKEASRRQTQRMIEDENTRYQSLVDGYDKELEALRRSLQEKVDNAQISEEQMNSELEQLQSLYNSNTERAAEQHVQRLKSIEDGGEAELKAIERQYNQERQQANADNFSQRLSSIRDFYDDIEKEQEKNERDSTDEAGFISYKDYKKGLDDAEKATKETVDRLKALRDELKDSYEAGDISFEEFKQMTADLDDFLDDSEEKLKDWEDKSKTSLNDWLLRLSDSISQYVDTFSDIWDTLSDMWTRSLDQRESALEEEQDMLDEELEMIEDQLEEQQSLTEEYSDKIDSTEDELSSARGDRRQALIDQLAAEKKAYAESIAEENKLAKQQEENQRKQEELEAEQDALEKERLKEQKAIDIVSATISTYTAATNALAVKPAPVGLALAATVTALGLANIAQISAQKYASGGLLDGKSHARGGMRIQGTNIEVEGGEYVVNKAQTAANLPLLEYVNKSRGVLTMDDLEDFYADGGRLRINKPMRAKFAEGGQLPEMSVDVETLMKGVSRESDDRPIVVSVVDIENAMENVRKVRTLSGDTYND